MYSNERQPAQAMTKNDDGKGNFLKLTKVSSKQRHEHCAAVVYDFDGDGDLDLYWRQKCSVQFMFHRVIYTSMMGRTFY
jgi:hypothetical protein